MNTTNETRLKTAIAYDMASSFDPAALDMMAQAATTRADILTGYAREESGRPDRDFGYIKSLLSDAGEYAIFAAHCAAMARHSREFTRKTCTERCAASLEGRR